MTVEQRPELNRFVRKTTPLTWGYWWQLFVKTLPLWLFSWICLIETGVLKAWFANRLTFGFVLTLCGVCLFLPIFTFSMARVQMWFEHRSKRSLRVKDRWISLSPARRQIVLWKSVAKFQFEPIRDLPGPVKLKLFLVGSSSRETTPRSRWSMVLENPTQLQELISCLQAKKLATAASFDIEFLEQPSPPEPALRFPTLGLSVVCVGMFLLLHGFPLLITCLTHGHSDPAKHLEITPQAAAKLGHLITKYFSSGEEFRRFVLALGIGLSGSGVILLWLGGRLMGRPPAKLAHSETSDGQTVT